MISDILGLEILVPENVESTATGAAIVSSIRDVKEDLKDLSLPSYTKYLPKGNSCEADFKEWQKFVQTLDQQYKWKSISTWSNDFHLHKDYDFQPCIAIRV